MADRFPYDLIEDPSELGTLQMWNPAVYADLLACRAGHMAEKQFNAKHQYTTAILGLDMTGFTHASLADGDLASMLRIFDVHRVCLPIFRKFGASKVRAFADDLYGTFADPVPALTCAMEIHRRVDAFNALVPKGHHPCECCVGLGYGPVFRLGPDDAMGHEMNLASKLGEDIAEGGETLVTESFRDAVRHLPGYSFERRTHPDFEFSYFAVSAVDSAHGASG